MGDFLTGIAKELDLFTSEIVHRLRVATAKDEELTGIQFFTLRLLAREGQMKVTEIAIYLGVTLSAITGLINRLYKLELVSRDQDQGDRRVVWVKPTEKGCQLIERANESRAYKIIAFLQELPEEDLKKTREVLSHITNKLGNGKY